MEITDTGILSAIAFVENKLAMSKSPKTKKEYENCLKHLKKHKIIFYNNRKGEKQLLFVKKHYSVVVYKSEYDTYHIRFRHPVIAEKNKRTGLNIRCSLLTENKYLANIMHKEMEELVHDDYWWSIDKRAEALTRFHRRVVQLFYSPMEK